ncbi:hypothetical protein [Amycolatopsis sp. NPDC021455]|uniref:hypothetical protein n=1 Tax=Amycolatopsis sp. NPDC021455 TaxID=3154901 RepID=UPI0033C8A271
MSSQPPEVVTCRDVFGRRREIKLTDRSEFITPGAVLEQRMVVANDLVLVRKFVSPAAGRRQPYRYDLLDNEIRAGTRIGQVFGPRNHPDELPRLVGYNMDDDEPFVLLRAYLGEPAAAAATRLDDGQRRNFQLGLLRALRCTAAAGVVHGAVGLSAVRWDGRRLQLVDFESAERAGEPRRAGGDPAIRSPEQRSGRGAVDVRDDVWGAALLIRRIELGVLGNGAWPDRTRDPERLRALLDPVLGRPVEERPFPADLLSRLRADDGGPPFADPEAGLAAGRARFDEAERIKRGPGQAALPDGGPGEPAGRRGGRERRAGRRSRKLFLLLLLVKTMAFAGSAVRR